MTYIMEVELEVPSDGTGQTSTHAAVSGCFGNGTGVACEYGQTWAGL